MIHLLDLDTKEDLAKIIAKVNQTEEPTFIIGDFKSEAVLLSYKSYEKLIRKYEELEKRYEELESEIVTAFLGDPGLPETYTLEELGIELTDIEYSDNDG